MCMHIHPHSIFYVYVYTPTLCFFMVCVQLHAVLSWHVLWHVYCVVTSVLFCCDTCTVHMYGTLSDQIHVRIHVYVALGGKHLWHDSKRMYAVVSVPCMYGCMKFYCGRLLDSWEGSRKKRANVYTYMYTYLHKCMDASLCTHTHTHTHTHIHRCFLTLFRILGGSLQASRQGLAHACVNLSHVRMHMCSIIYARMDTWMFEAK